MDAGSEAVDLMVREGLQITEASIKLLAAGSKNLAAWITAARCCSSGEKSR